MYEMQGPCPVSGRWPAGCPAGWRLIDRLLVPDSRRKRRFPGSSCVPGLPPDWCPSPAVTYFYPPGRVRHKGSRAVISGFFSCPQPIHRDGAVVPRKLALFHRTVHSIRGRPQDLSAGPACRFRIRA
jgi:hypothetical protein